MIERKFLAHYINVTPSKGDTATYFRLGKDLEEYNVELSAKVDKKENILGENSVVLSAYEPTASVEPYYAEKEDGLHEFLQDIIDNRKVLDDVKTDVVEVHLWENATGSGNMTYVAYKESAVVEVSHYGGDNTGYQIPFNVHYMGDRVKGTFDVSTKKFTAADK